jgi:hypothetical protein
MGEGSGTTSKQGRSNYLANQRRAGAEATPSGGEANPGGCGAIPGG